LLLFALDKGFCYKTKLTNHSADDNFSLLA